jgi:hypothetical protein
VAEPKTRPGGAEERTVSEANVLQTPGDQRGWVRVYAIAFVLLAVAGGLFVASFLGRLESIRLLWASAGVSVAAIVVAAVSVLAPRRR